MKLLHQFQHITNPYSSNPSSKQESLYEEADITSAVKPVGRDMATIEAEKDEIIVKPDLSGIYKIKGKRHYAGGTPLQAEAGSFIFSDYQKLSLKKDDQKLMEFKLGGITKSKNTPAKVLERNIDIEHYNRSVNIIDDPYRDIIAKKSAQLMLDKYQTMLGRIAYLQEEKKQFKEGTPNFVEGTAPVRDEDMQKQIDEQEQYKTGGMTNFYKPDFIGNPYEVNLFGKERLKYEQGGEANPYLPQAQKGTTVGKNTYEKELARLQMMASREVNNPSSNKYGDAYLKLKAQGSFTPLSPKDELERLRVLAYDEDPNESHYADIYNTARKAVTTNTTTGVVNNIPTTTIPTNDSQGYPSWLKMWDKANQNPGGYTTPTGEDSRYNSAVGNEIYDNYNHWKELHGGKEFSDAKDYQKFVYDYINEKDPSAINKMWSKMGLNNASMTDADVQSGKIFGQFADGMFGARTAALTNWKPNKANPPVIANVPANVIPIAATLPKTLNVPVNNNRYLPYEPNVRKTMPMIQNEVIAGLNAVGVKRFDPARPQIKTPLVELDYLNSQGALNSVNQSVNEAYNATRGLNPYQAQSSMNEIFGKSLAAKGDINFKYDQANNEIGNRQSQLNQGVQRQDMIQNNASDQKYVDQTNLSDAHFYNAQGVARNAWQGVRNNNQEKLDSLYNVLAQQPIAGSKPVLDKNGNQAYDNNGKALMQSMPLYDVTPGTIRTTNTGVGNILNASGGRNQTDYYEALNKQMARADDMTLSETTRKIAAAQAQTLQKLIAAANKKKLGGLINPYKQ